jgi:hypothetical protein
LHINRRDGDSIRVWIKARDVMNNTAVDEILIHVDSSPAEITNIGLSYNGKKQLAVHNKIELYESL